MRYGKSNRPERITAEQRKGLPGQSSPKRNIHALTNRYSGSGRGSRPQTGTANKKGVTKRDTLKHPDRIKENPV